MTPDICNRCGIGTTEKHHYAPKHLFPDFKSWGTVPLCRQCHMRWHQIMTPNMGKEATKTALQSLKNSGKRLGRPVMMAQDTRNRVAELRAAGMTMQAVADTLNAENVPTARGGKWYASTVRGVLRSLELDAEALKLLTERKAA